jgi:hypothetical protein
VAQNFKKTKVNIIVMSTIIMIFTFIGTYALMVFVLFLVARMIFPFSDELKNVKQFKTRNVKRFSRAA